MSTARTSDLWWKNAVVYCLDVETFLDADGDGCGDLVAGRTVGPARRRSRVPRRRGLNLDQGRHHRPVVPPPLLPPPARPEHRPPGGARGIAKIVGFWLELGVDGFRVDAVPYLIETGGVQGDIDLDPHGFLKDLRSFISRRRGDAVLLGEVNLAPKPLRAFFGDEQGDELQLLFGFPVMQAMYLALARRDARPLAKALGRNPPIPADCQWATFVRNHDELTLDQLSERERQEVFAAFGPDPDMQLFGRGLRRRLPPMLDGDQQRIRLVYSLLFSLPGTPVLFYGEEIGMGENLDIMGRMSVRTPMQWTDQVNAGFSGVRPSKLRRPIPEGRFGPLAVNVAQQRRDPDSLLSWMERVIRRRRETPELGWGQATVLATSAPAVLAHRCDWEASAVLAVHNLGDEPCVVDIDVGCDPDSTLVDLLGGGASADVLAGDRLELQLEAYGYRWFRVQAPGGPSTP